MGSHKLGLVSAIFGKVIALQILLKTERRRKLEQYGLEWVIPR